MTSLDQAFIRAYGRGKSPVTIQNRAQASEDLGLSGGPAEQALPFNMTADSEQTTRLAIDAGHGPGDPHIVRKNSPRPPRSTQRAEKQALSRPAPQAQIANTTLSPQSDLDVISEIEDAQLHDDEFVDEESEIPSRDPSRPGTKNLDHSRSSITVESNPNEVRAAFEVRRFAWPHLIDNLVRRTRDQLSGMEAKLLGSGQHTPVIMVCSPAAGAGSTTLALVMARWFCKKGYRTALCDTNFASPQIAEQLSVVPQVGLAEVIDENIPLAEAMIESLDDQLTLIPLKEQVDHPLDWDQHPIWEKTMAMLHDQYDVVILDAGAWDDAITVLDLWGPPDSVRPNAAVIVHQPEKSFEDRAANLARRLRGMGIGNCHLAENFVTS